MTKKIIVAQLEILKGKEHDFMELTPELIRLSQAEPGCLRYDLYQNPSRPSEFLFYEEYKDGAAFEQHGASSHFQTFAKGVQALLAKELDIQQF